MEGEVIKVLTHLVKCYGGITFDWRKISIRFLRWKFTKIQAIERCTTLYFSKRIFQHFSSFRAYEEFNKIAIPKKVSSNFNKKLNMRSSFLVLWTVCIVFWRNFSFQSYNAKFNSMLNPWMRKLTFWLNFTSGHDVF